MVRPPASLRSAARRPARPAVLVLALAAAAVPAGVALATLDSPPGTPPSTPPQTPPTPPSRPPAKPGEPPATPPKTPATPSADPKQPSEPHPAPPDGDKPRDLKPAGEQRPGDRPADPSQADPAYVLGFNVNRIDGAAESLEQYKGKVILIVNTASKCGYTPQYAGLEKLYEEKKDRGLVVLGFPANNFGKQEPGTNDEIREFCSSRYSVTFPMFQKVDVKGDTAAPLYKKLAAQPAPIGGEPKWNFTKFLVDRSGRVVARYEPSTAPEDKKLQSRIDELLAQPPVR